MLNVQMLDDFAFGNVDFIKIDVEGFELEVLKGAESLLQKSSPILYIEIFNDRFDEVNLFLEKIGYQKKEQLALYDYIYMKSQDYRELL